MKSTFKKTRLSIAIAASAFFVSGAVVADTNAEIQNLKKRIAQLEQSTMAKSTIAQSANAPTESKSIEINISGVVEIEAGYVRNDGYDGKTSSDIVVATAALAFEADVAEGVNAHIGLLHEEDDTDLEVDEAHISFERGIMFASAGQVYVPFGGFASNLVSDPLTLDLGETRETAVEMGVNVGPAAASIYVFNGDVDDNAATERNKTEMYGVSLTLADGDDNFSYEFGLDYISSIADTDTLQEAVVGGAIDDYVAGVSIDASVVIGAANVNLEYTTARDEFEASELAFNAKGAKPAAFNVEVGYVVNVVGFETQLAASYQRTKEALALGLPEKRIAFAASTLVADNTSLSIELARDYDYGQTDTGTAEEIDAEGTGETSNMATIQLAVAF